MCLECSLFNGQKYIQLVEGIPSWEIRKVQSIMATKEGQKMTSFIRFWNCSSGVEHDQVKI